MSCWMCNGCKVDVQGEDGLGRMQFVSKPTGCTSCCAGQYCFGHKIGVARKDDPTKLVAYIARPPLSCKQFCGHMNDMLIQFLDPGLTESDKLVIANMCFCMEFEYFSPNFNNN